MYVLVTLVDPKNALEYGFDYEPRHTLIWNEIVEKCNFKGNMCLRHQDKINNKVVDIVANSSAASRPPITPVEEDSTSNPSNHWINTMIQVSNSRPGLQTVQLAVPQENVSLNILCYADVLSVLFVDLIKRSSLPGRRRRKLSR